MSTRAETIRILERAAERVERGELTARATPSKFADPRIEQLTRVFNRMLDSTAADRERLREVAARAFQAQEAERMRIARELNEETAQTLAMLLLGVGAVRRAADAKTQDELMEELRQEITDLTERVRGFARGLYPPTLKQLGVVAAVGAHVRAVEESSGIAVEVEGDDVRGVLSPEGEIALYRIVQDALANVVRHAGAKQARIGICRHDSGVEATVEG
jgi:two-component system sensor histidine kinase UhpB